MEDLSNGIAILLQCCNYYIIENLIGLNIKTNVINKTLSVNYVWIHLGLANPFLSGLRLFIFLFKTKTMNKSVWFHFY